MKPIWLGSSWKMNKTRQEVVEFCQEFERGVARFPDGIQGFLIPPFPYVETVTQALSRLNIVTGVQNMCWESQGAYTGEISPLMVRDLGAHLVEIGHSERREMFNETDETVNKKARSALEHGLTPLICVGDTLAEKNWGVSKESIVRQVKIALSGVSLEQMSSVLIAYEPVWAIGENGTPASADEAEIGLGVIRVALLELYGAEIAKATILLYGGSVNPDNAFELVSQPNIDGLFVGRAAWDAAGYLSLLSIVEKYESTRSLK
ncbi:triose-phosphate isomerase [Vibrio breoganii]|uniref:triose-phosphate isomerase n=1 Tax=Vibrio breoganii TaxID=553239 RepID=UPI000C836CB2|nr:triose-phosphate isomerase [Vibrio breoganii]PMF98863.1 triose-phosphate isomerase [Vibrio breoganii]PMG32325.1 triose-phosphate isomerase [Vibrio breoganii]PMG82411.1 triose-phosphate isomerase [Vibrio breoganii]PMG92149.1 triose-phosphate isomerase [Vibrio breoganii]PMK17132.1 triose-phosphate isomerase [Vibrio breoganii]